MRTAFIDTLYELAKKDARVNLIVSDLGFSVVDKFAQKLPNQFLNVGVAEQNMAGVAAGMSKVNDKIVFIYSIANFSTLRCLEQIRNDICFNKANVKIISIGGGVAYGKLGYSHYAVEDLGFMRNLPGMVVSAPGDPYEAEAITRLAYETKGPWYIRLGKDGEPKIHQDQLDKLNIGQGIEICDGDKGTIITTGSIITEALNVVQELRLKGIHIRLISFPFLKPVDSDIVKKAFEATPWILTIEEHFRIGGLRATIADIVLDFKLTKPVYSLCLSEESIHDVGDQKYILKKSGLDSESIFQFVQKLL